MKTCEQCEHFKRKSMLDDDNNKMKIPVCKHFSKRLQTTKPCSDFERSTSVYEDTVVMMTVYSICVGLSGLFYTLIHYARGKSELGIAMMLLSSLFFLVISAILMVMHKRLFEEFNIFGKDMAECLVIIFLLWGAFYFSLGGTR